jgi:hypothetical protein
VCPSALCGGLFSVAAVGNFDHDPSSPTAVSAFRGTAVSVIQFPSVDNVALTIQYIIFQPRLRMIC